MRTDKRVKVRTCDECGKSVSDNGDIKFGSVWSGWFQISKTINTVLVNGGIIEDNTWDFCSDECLSVWVRERETL